MDLPEHVEPPAATEDRYMPTDGDPFVDVGALLAGGLPEPPAPTVCRRTDGVGLFYPGQVNTVFGDPESGKTWLGYVAVVEALTDGVRAFIVDADHNGVDQVVSRLLALGASPEVLEDRDRFRLCEPEDASVLRLAVTLAELWKPRVAVVDSVGEVLPIFGLSSNSPDDFTVANREVLRPLARSGAAVVAIDHPAKGAESRQAGPSGTVAKGRTVGGTSLRVTLREPFTPGRGGSAVLSIRKDRPGGLRAKSPGGSGERAAGVFRLDSTEDALAWTLTPATDADAVTSAQMSGAAYIPSSDELAAVHALPESSRTQRGVKEALGAGSDKAVQIIREYATLSEAERSLLLTSVSRSKEQEQECSRSAPGAQEQSAPCSSTQGSGSKEQERPA